MTKIAVLAQRVQEKFQLDKEACTLAHGEITIIVARANLLSVCVTLRDNAEFAFEELSDLCGVDYSAYGMTEWETESASSTGFSRGAELAADGAHSPSTWSGARFAAVYHLLSVKNNQRLRVRCFCDDEPPVLDSVTDIWASANWYEREAFDLFGIIFEGHSDLRRLLTDYGFIGHPFRKDFPLIGHVEMRYDAQKARVVYQPVSIEPRVLVPRVIRDDHRYMATPPPPPKVERAK